MTRLRKIGTMTTPKRDHVRRSGRARILRGSDGRPVRARRLKEPPGLRVKLLRFGLVLVVFGFFALVWTRPVNLWRTPCPAPEQARRKTRHPGIGARTA